MIGFTRLSRKSAQGAERNYHSPTLLYHTLSKEEEGTLKAQIESVRDNLKYLALLSQEYPSRVCHLFHEQLKKCR